MPTRKTGLLSCIPAQNALPSRQMSGHHVPYYCSNRIQSSSLREQEPVRIRAVVLAGETKSFLQASIVSLLHAAVGEGVVT